MKNQKAAKSPFIWITRKGEVQYVDEMATPHIFYALRMLFNHAVPPAFRIGDFKRYPELEEWSNDYKLDAQKAFLTELKLRDDLESELQYELDDMFLNADALANIYGLV